MGDGDQVAPHSTPIMLDASMKGEETFSANDIPFGNLIDVLETGQDVKDYHVEKLINSGKIASNFIIINDATINSDGTLNDDYTEQKVFS
jgi:hypothetical protein